MSESEGVIVGAAEAADLEARVVDGDEQVRGVGGWLLFFCVSLTILSPVASLALLGYGVFQSAPYFAQNFPVMALVLADAGLSVALVGAYVYAGVSLWRVRPQAVQVTRVVLIVSAVYALLAPLEPLLLGLDAAGRQQVIDAWMQTGWRGAMYSVIWLNYLMQSKRVRATYVDWNPPTARKFGPDAKWYHFVFALLAVAAIVAAAVWFTR